MVFIMEGMSLRIPAGGLSISVDEAGNLTGSLSAMHVAYEIWPHWLEIALDHAELSSGVRQELLGLAQTDDREKSRLLIEECKASMVGITASVIGLEAFFAGVCEHLPAYADLRSRWDSQKKKPARAGQVSQVLHRAFRYDSGAYSRIVDALKELYRFRDVAVHPSAGYQPPIQHDVLGVGVEWRFAAFTAPNAVKAASLACDIIHHSIGVPRASLPTLEDWCELARAKTESAHMRASELRATVSTRQDGRGTDYNEGAGS